MIPLTVTIMVIYGVIGLSGKAYDMPVAVLSSLALGLAVDFAIHFLARARSLRAAHDSWEDTLPAMFGEPARAISRNVIVIAVGFTPLLLAPLTPYQTVGMLLASILLLSGVATLVIMPALVRVLAGRLFRTVRTEGGKMPCSVCIASVNAVVAVAVISLARHTDTSLSLLLGVGAAVGVVVSALCCLLGRRGKHVSVTNR
jgi:uncharacterized membrane protein YdfJ with MMPL/SSD domain